MVFYNDPHYRCYINADFFSNEEVTGWESGSSMHVVVDDITAQVSHPVVMTREIAPGLMYDSPIIFVSEGCLRKRYVVTHALYIGTIELVTRPLTSYLQWEYTRFDEVEYIIAYISDIIVAVVKCTSVPNQN